VDTNNLVVENANNTRPHGNFVLDAFGRASEHRHTVDLDCAFANGDIYGNLARVYHTAHGWQDESAFVPDVYTFERNLTNSYMGHGMAEFLHQLRVQKNVVIAGGSVLACMLPNAGPHCGVSAFPAGYPPRAMAEWELGDLDIWQYDKTLQTTRCKPRC
jgi:hypothetical protein